MGEHGANEILRDYLYLDVDRMKSIAGQLENGVPEESRQTLRGSKRTSVGWDKLLSYAPESVEESSVSRSMVDSLFPEFERLLEQGWMLDVSDQFAEETPELLSWLRVNRPEGSLFRVTADGFLFDVRHLASLFSNFSIAIAGYQEFEVALVDLRDSMEKQAAGALPKKAAPRKQVRREPSSVEQLEDLIDEFAPQYDMSPRFMRSMLHTARGVFSPGLQLIICNSTESGSFSISARLQDAARYLDAPPEVVASRYGGQAQRWTMIGSVGHYSEPAEEAALASLATQVENEISEDFNRPRFIKTMNNFVRDIANSGMADYPQHPGMTAIPIAVYRAVAGPGHYVSEM